jgi:hypothetical protein
LIFFAAAIIFIAIAAIDYAIFAAMPLIFRSLFIFIDMILISARLSRHIIESFSVEPPLHWPLITPMASELSFAIDISASQPRQPAISHAIITPPPATPIFAISSLMFLRRHDTLIADCRLRFRRFLYFFHYVS